ncbi:MAG TPA: HNH endonuclease [Caulobacteraceae bacterium]|nr:HNH endonuclease [Caulobacteraceae bacterium]
MKRARICYGPAEMAWLEANRSLIISDYYRAFQAAFGRGDVSMANLHALRKRKGWKVGREPGRTKGRRLRYSAAEIQWLRANCTLPIAEYLAAFTAAFPGHDVSAENLNGLRKREGWKTGRTGQFAKGQPPANKGKTCPPGVGGRHPNARKTQFQKGARTGKAARNYKPVGFERMRDGYLVRKINEDLPLQARWRAVHLIRWEALNGPLPKGHCLKCLDGDQTNTDPSNWELIPRGALVRLNAGPSKKGRLAYDEAAPEVRPALIAMARIEHQAGQLRRRRSKSAASEAP